jgi:ATP-binding cassette subfamily F protein 3
MRDPHRLGDIHERLLAIDAYAGAPARAARILLGLGFDEEMQAGRSTASRAAGRCASRSPPCCSPSPTCCCSTSRRTISTSKRRCGSRISSRAIPGTLVVDQPRARPAQQCRRHILHLEGGKITLYPGGYDASSGSAPSAPRSSPRPRAAGRAARPPAGLYRPQQRPRLDRQAGPVARQDAGQDAADRRAADDPSLSFDFPSPTELRRR